MVRSNISFVSYSMLKVPGIFRLKLGIYMVNTAINLFNFNRFTPITVDTGQTMIFQFRDFR